MQEIENITDLDTAKQMLAVAFSEIERLNKRIATLTTQLAAAKGKPEADQLQLELQHLQEQLGSFQHKVFGDSSEKRPRDKGPRPSKKPKRGHGPREQPELTKQEVLFELPESDRNCRSCGKEMTAVPGLTEDSTVIAKLSQQFWELLAKRQKYRCSCNGALRVAPGPHKAIEGGRYTLDFAVNVAVDKYADALPLERQVRIMKRAGLLCDSQTLWDQLDALALHLEPSYLALREYIIGADVIGADETWWRLMQKKANKKWYAWGLTTHDACWYKLADSRSAKLASEVLDGFEGTVLCDGYKAYETVAKECRSIKLAHCWAHVRRKFVEAEQNYPVPCGEALEMIGELFAIEERLLKADSLEGDAKVAVLDLRKAERDKRSRPLLDKLKAWALTQRGLPKSGLRKAVDYMLVRWKGLCAFLDDPHVEIHNNQTERALRGMVLGRKNHYGSRSKRGTEVAAIMYSLVESAKLCGVNPVEYLFKAAVRAIKTPGAAMLPNELTA